MKKSKKKVKTPETSDDDKTPIEDESEIIFDPNRHSSVKIYVNACDNNSHDSEPSEDEKPIKGEYSMKHICFRFGRKNKKNQGVSAKRSACYQDDGNQTSRKNSGKTIPEEMDVSESEINNFLQGCKKGWSNGGGCNTNTIIFPKGFRDGRGDDGGLQTLQNFIKGESQSNAKILEDIVNELGRQRKEIRDVKDTLDSFLRLMRETLFMLSYGSLNENFDKGNKTNDAMNTPRDKR